jgi:hypothetical protein
MFLRVFQIQWSFTKIKQTESNKKVALFPHGDKASDTSIVEGGLMMKSEKFSNADMYCSDCSETIQTYIRQHLQ